MSSAVLVQVKGWQRLFQPLGVVIFGALLPIAILLYLVSSNVWTLVQQRVVYQRLDAQDTGNILTRTQPQPARPVQHLDSATPPAESAARRVRLRQRPGRHRKATRTRRPPPSPP